MKFINQTEKQERRKETKYIVPLKLKEWMVKVAKISPQNVIELNWWDSIQINQNLVVHAVPSQHWSKIHFSSIFKIF